MGYAFFRSGMKSVVPQTPSGQSIQIQCGHWTTERTGASKPYRVLFKTFYFIDHSFSIRGLSHGYSHADFNSRTSNELIRAFPPLARTAIEALSGGTIIPIGI